MKPEKLTAGVVMELEEQIRNGIYAQHTKVCRTKALRQILRWLWEYHGAPKLDQVVRRYGAARPRNVIVTDEEKEALLKNASDHMRLWLLLCADLALRSGTAQQIGPKNYNKERREIRFQTKCDEHLTLPITEEIRLMFEKCNLDSDVSFVNQLWMNWKREKGSGGRSAVKCLPHRLRAQFRGLLESVGIRKRITPHDLRRTAAVAMLEYSNDIRDVQMLLGHKNMQSTFWYLDHDARKVKRSTLEIIKQPAWRKEQAS